MYSIYHPFMGDMPSNVGLVKHKMLEKSGFACALWFGGAVCVHKKSITQQANKLILSTAIQHKQNNKKTNERI